ncbi:hypothetical protein ACVWW7_007718 [Bradyrhizobium sp. LM6.9]
MAWRRSISSCRRLVDLGVHLRLEKAIGAASGGFGGVHRHVRVLQDLVERRSVVGCQCDADAGVGGKMMAHAVKRRADGLEQPRDELVDLIQRRHRALYDGEFVAAKPRHEVRRACAPAEALRDRLQEFVADEMPERVVDALELVDVDIVHRELFTRGDESQFLAQMLVEQGAVGQVGQRIVMSEMGDALLDAPALRDVLMCRHPAAVRERFVDDLDRATVGGVDHHRIAHMDVAQDPCDIRVHIAGERAGGAAVCNDVAEATAGSHDFGRQPVHLDVALIADHELLRGVEQQQALGHVVDGAVKTLLFQR